MTQSISTRTAIAFSIGARYMVLVAQFASTMLLARLLTPAEIGIYSAGFTIVALAHLFRDFGLTQYLIQEPELDSNKIATAFTLTILMSWSLGALVFATAIPAAEFFRQAGITPLVQLLSLNFFIIPFGSITMAILRKQMKFQITATIAIIATLLGIIVAVVSAFQGASYYCLAYGAIAETGAIVLMSLFFRPPGLGFKLSFHGGAHILKFGSLVGAGNIIKHFSLNATDALIARAMGVSALGYYSRAFGTFSLFDRLFTSSINPVVLPLFSRSRGQVETIRNGYIKAVDYTIIFAWPFFGFLYFFTAELVMLLYGPQWGDAVPLTKVLCLAGLVLPPALFSDNLFIALGRPDITLKIRVAASTILIVLVALSVDHGLNAVCFSMVAYFTARSLLTLFYVKRSLDLPPGFLAGTALKALPCVILAIAPALLLKRLLLPNNDSLLLPMATIGLVTLVGWLCGLYLARHPFTRELDNLIKKFVGGRFMRSNSGK